MDYRLQFLSEIDSRVELPASKSISNRALVINALSESSIKLQNIAVCDDTTAMLEAISSDSNVINIGAAGTTMRFLTSYFASQPCKDITLDGSERMRNRPIKILVDALRSIGADIKYIGAEGYPPLHIKGKTLSGCNKIELQGSVSSQYISSIMMISPYIKGGMTITLTGNLISLSYIDMTIAIMKDFGVTAVRKDNVIIIPEGKYTTDKFTIENDWSAASYWFEIVSLIPGSKIVLSGLNKSSVQGDSKVREYFNSLYVDSEFNENGDLTLTHNSDKCVKQLNIELSNQPDLTQTIVVTACLKSIPFNITGLSTLKIKETDRLTALKVELAKLGYDISIVNDSALVWNGERITPDEAPKISTYKDHRMAMSFAPAAIVHHSLTITDADVVSKSYPQFWQQLEKIGVAISK